MADAAVQNPELDERRGHLLLLSAAKTLAAVLFDNEIVYPDPSAFDSPLSLPGASFVTYEHKGSLVGCIGSIKRELPLVVDAARNALLAAFADPRTPGLTAVPLDGTSLKISVLSEAVGIEASSFDDVIAAVRPGVDGLIVEYKGRRATLLPAVWEKIDSVEDFLDVLWKKAGLQPRYFDTGFVVSRYETTEFCEPDLSRLIRRVAL